MSKIVAIFAHPDDESIGPGGTLAKLALDNEVYLICSTRGEKGGSLPNLAKVRSNELEKAAQILGIKTVYQLDFPDGGLSNSLYQKLGVEIEKILLDLKPTNLITFDKQGLTGHIDHIVVSMVTTFLFHKLTFVKTLWYNCLLKDNQEAIKDYFVYFPPGYSRSEIDRVEDVSSVWDIKVSAMRAHASQKADVDPALKVKGKSREEYFLVLEK